MLARYWRVFCPYSTDGYGIRVCGIELWNSTSRVCQSATLTSNRTPTSGSLSNLKDESFATECYFDESTIGSLFNLTWDAGSGNQIDVEFVRIRTANDINEFPGIFNLEYSQDGIAWTTLLNLRYSFKLKYPGNYQLTNILPAGSIYPTKFMESKANVTLDSTRTIVNYNVIRSNTFNIITEFFASSGKYYVEMVIGYRPTLVGVLPYFERLNDKYPGQFLHSAGQYLDNGNIYYNATSASYEPDHTTAFAIGKTIGVKIDIDAGTIAYICDGVEKPDFTVGFNNKFMCVSTGTNAVIDTIDDRLSTFNFGENPFFYPVPSGYTAGFGPQYEIETIDHRNDILLKGDGHLYSPHSLSNIYGVKNVYDSNLALMPNFGGYGYIKNTVKIKGTPDIPVRRRVMLFDLRSRVIVGETWSQEGTGLFEFKHLDMNLTYFAMSIDHTGQWQIAGAGPMKPEKMILV